MRTRDRKKKKASEIRERISKDDNSDSNDPEIYLLHLLLRSSVSMLLAH